MHWKAPLLRPRHVPPFKQKPVLHPVPVPELGFKYVPELWKDEEDDIGVEHCDPVKAT